MREISILALSLAAFSCSGNETPAPTATGGSGGSSNTATGGSTGGGVNSGGGSNASGGGAGAPSFEYKACPDDQRVGGFSLQLIPPKQAVPGTSALTGAVLDKVNPRFVWTIAATEGECKLLTGPSLLCAPSCADGQICAGSNSCIATPVAHSVGAVTVMGLTQELVAMPLGDKTYYGPISGAYPPVAPGAGVSLRTAGGDYASFTLQGAGITSLEVPTERFPLESGKAVNLSWTVGQGGQSRMLLSLDIAHHGGISAKIQCDVADTGSATVPPALVTQLVEKGTAGFPTVSFTRRTISATTIAPGCVDFGVSSSVERELVVAGVTSCTCDYGDSDPGCIPCPTAGQACRVDLTCG